MFIRSAFLATAVSALLLSQVSVAHADSPVHMLYTFDDCRNGHVDCTRVITDSSGYGNNGTVIPVSNGSLSVLAGRHKLGVLPSSAVIRLDSASRDSAFSPGTKAFSFGATVKANGKFNDGENLLQRGRFSDTTDQWKLQLDAGRQGCVIKGDQGRVFAFSPTDLPVDGRWHKVSCEVTKRYITYVVDGRKYRNPNTAGSITLADSDLVYAGGVLNTDGTINDPFTLPFDDLFFSTTR